MYVVRYREQIVVSVMLKYQPSYSSFAVAVAYLALSSIPNVFDHDVKSSRI
jgi:hypothetical protein